MNKKVVYLDMDGTIADLYGQENWLYMLQNEIAGAFENCKPLTNMENLEKQFPPTEYELRILSMTPKNASKKYCQQVIKEKNAWLDKYFPNITKRTYLPYGDNKNLKGCRKHILVDDNETIRNNFKGLALAPMWA